MRRPTELLEDSVAILSYAEVRAIMLAWARLPAWNPALRARSTVAMLLAEGVRDNLRERAQNELRVQTRTLLDARRLAPAPFDHAMGPGQLGNTDGLESIFHVAGRAAGAYRGSDSKIFSLAINLADMIRSVER